MGFSYLWKSLSLSTKAIFLKVQPNLLPVINLTIGKEITAFLM